MSRDAVSVRECRACRHFRNDAKFLEAAFPGLTAMSSAFGSTRADDGICLRHDRYLGARASCADFSAAPSAAAHPQSP
jgi:hypothetical protein